jgi:hypothetical protein
MGGVALPIAVVGGDQAHRLHPVAGFFADLADDRFGGALADVGPPARQRPAAVIGLFDEQYLAVVEHRRPYVYFGGRGTRLELE